MTSEKIVERNRANAQKSTGPKTSRGKAVVAGNARRHGATSSPAKGSVTAWLAIILDDPDITVDALLSSDARSSRALALALAEARLVAAEQALADFEREGMEANAIPEDILEEIRNIREAAQYSKTIRKKATLLKKSFSVKARFLMSEIHRIENTHRLLRRYLREARSGRRRAFQDWVDLIAPSSSAGVERRKTAEYRNKPSTPRLHA